MISDRRGISRTVGSRHFIRYKYHYSVRAFRYPPSGLGTHVATSVSKLVAHETPVYDNGPISSLLAIVGYRDAVNTYKLSTW